MRERIAHLAHTIGAFFNPDVPHKNSFNFIRLSAAVMVVFSHSYAIVGAQEPRVGAVNLGAVGVWIFFLLSGYLVSVSWHQHPRFNVFIAKRALRIFPGLFVMLVVTIIAGTFFTTLNASQYLLNQSTVSYLNNLLLYVPQFSLPGVFDHNPYPSVVNGSIWTLPYEFTMYILLGIIGATKFYKKVSIRKLWIILIATCLLIYSLFHEVPSFSLFFLNVQGILPFALMFFTGVFIQEKLDIEKTRPLWGIVAIVLFLLGCQTIPYLAPIFGATLLAYAVFAFGSMPQGAWLQKYGDFSYGIYIYAFPVQQALEQITQTSSVRSMFLASIVISGTLAIFSWFLVENPFIGLKRKLRLDRYPVTQADEVW